MSKLDANLFTTIVENTPLVSIDLIIENSDGKILLGKRLNRPARNMWFVPGGRILKDETISRAFSRISIEELGKEYDLSTSHFLGVYEHFYPDNFGDKNFTTHYVVLGYRLELDLDIKQFPTSQHDDYRWWERSSLLDSDDVHEHSKWYLS